MNYKTIEDLNKDIKALVPKLPPDLDLIVGVPRSGLLAANLLALYLNLPLTDVDGLCQKRIMRTGRRFEGVFDFTNCRNVLVIDDSINSGTQMQKVRLAIEQANLSYKIYYAAIYATSESNKYIDFWSKLIEQPRCFEWNIMHHGPLLENSCVDLDGVLCRDPTDDENDDGANYRDFLRNVAPSSMPSVEIGWIVTCRLEKYRDLTEAWLKKHGIKYRNLVMMNLPDKKTRVALGNHALFKAEAYKSTDTILFIESSFTQAQEIARISGKAVLCIETNQIVQRENVQGKETEFEHDYNTEHANPELYCPFCEKYSTEFLPTGLDIPVLKEKNVVGGGYRLNAMCPQCHSTDRERLIYLYLKNKKGALFSKNFKVLHVAPEENLQKVLMAQPNIEYLSADLSSPLAAVQMDITDIKYQDDSFDIVICNHVLEHIPDDRKAMSELYRVLKPGGWAILQVPISLSLDQTYGDPMITSPEEREKAFGQNDHVRIYAKDYRDRLEKVGFSVEVYSFTEEFGESAIRQYGLLKDENIYICSKPALGEEFNHDVEYKGDEIHLSRFRLLSHLIEGQKVLEIACGNGDLSLEIAKLGFDVVGVDISEQGIRQAVELAKKENLDTKAQFMVMDATSLEFPDSSFDTVLIPEVLEHTRDSRKLLEEAVRVMRNGGRIVVSVPDGLSVPFPGHLRVFFKDTVTTELSQYAEEITWHELPFKKWLVCSFFVRKKAMDITEGPLIDIMMPTYNGRKYIKNAIKSVINQTYQNWNLIVVNDGGEDVKDILDEFQDSRIKYIVAEHKGKSHALNVGIKNSNGEFIGYLDDDDILYPVHLEVLIKAASEENKNFVYSDWYEVSLDENNTEVGREFEYRLDVAPWMLIQKNYINHKCILHKRSLLKKTGMYDEELNILIDWDMIRRLAFVCKPYRITSVTSERIRYYNKGTIGNRITGLWWSNPEKARQSVAKIARNTTDLPARTEDLKKAFVKSMLSLGYYHHLEIAPMLQAKDAQIHDLATALQAKDAQIHDLATALQAKDAQIASLEMQLQQTQRGIAMQLVSRYQSVIEKLLRPGTRRRYYYELGLTGIRVILNEGWRSFRSRFKGWYSQRKTEGNLLEADSSIFVDKAILHSIQDVPASKEIAVVLHLYYTDLWQEMASYLTNISQPFDLFVSVPLNASEEVIRDIIHCYPGAHILHTKNRGRDIAPFLELFEVILKRGYSCALKIHTKRSPHREDGDIWRRDVLGKLIGNGELVEKILFSLRHMKDIGLIAPSGHILALKSYVGSNAYHMENLGRRLGLTIDDKLGFCAGSIFWFKPEALSRLLDLNLTYTDFEPETGQVDGALGHAIERFIGQVVAANHYTIITEQDVLCGRFQGGDTIIDHSYKFVD